MQAAWLWGYLAPPARLEQVARSQRLEHLAPAQVGTASIVQLQCNAVACQAIAATGPNFAASPVTAHT